MGKKFITSALPYVNNQPHLGNIVGCVLGGDIYTRYCKKMGDDCIYICGTDEYGTATEMEAMKQNVKPREIVEKNRLIHKKIYDWLGLNFDYFGNTDCSEHIKMTQEVFKKCYENGYFDEENIEQYFCIKCEQFLADRYVEGECYLCGYNSARGDQCDKCGRCLKAEELKNPKCVLCEKQPELRTTKHLFLRLDLLQDKIKSHFEDKKMNWTDNARNIYEEWIKKDIHSRCMTRTLKYKWGVPVPLSGFEDKVFYVWFDAPIGYFTFLSQALPNWKEWASNAEFIQFMGKDNVPFHSIIFPGMILATRPENAIESRKKKLEEINCSFNNCFAEKCSVKNSQTAECSESKSTEDKFEYPIVDVINSTEYLTFNGEKFSKSRRVGIFGLDLLENDLGSPSLWRYYLTKKRPETKDGDFITSEFIQLVNGDLISNFGNFCNRTLSYISKRLGGTPKPENLDDFDKVFIDEVNGLFTEYKNLMKKINLRDALVKCFEISMRGNKYLQDMQANKSRQPHAFSLCYSLVVFLGHIFEPFIPEVSLRIFRMCKQSNGPMPDLFKVVECDRISEEISVLFTPLTSLQLENLEKFGIKKV